MQLLYFITTVTSQVHSARHHVRGTVLYQASSLLIFLILLYYCTCVMNLPSIGGVNLCVSLQCHEFEAWEDVIIHLMYSYVHVRYTCLLYIYTCLLHLPLNVATCIETAALNHKYILLHLGLFFLSFLLFFFLSRL